MARRAIVKATEMKAQTQQQQAKMHGGGGGGAQVQGRSKDIAKLDRALDVKKPEATVGSVTFAPETGRNWEARLNSLNEKFHNLKSSRRKGKVASLKVIDDGRITPDERLRLFVLAAAEQGYTKEQAVEYGLRRMEAKGDLLAGSSKNKAQEMTLDELLGQ